MCIVAYSLQIYADTVSGAIVTLESKTPFGAISAGDLINPEVYGNHTQSVLRVKKVEHLFFKINDTDNYRHRVALYTESVPNSEDILR